MCFIVFAALYGFLEHGIIFIYILFDFQKCLSEQLISYIKIS